MLPKATYQALKHCPAWSMQLCSYIHCRQNTLKDIAKGKRLKNKPRKPPKHNSNNILEKAKLHN